jgi:DNA (cytosine-5)-methyltransferase 1
MFESLRLIETSKPQYVLWENVAAVLAPKHRHNFIKYLEKLSELGYESAFDLLNGKNYGIPQNRLRLFCVSRKINSDDNIARNIDDMPKSSNKQVESTMKEIRNNPNIRMWVDYKMPETISLTTRLKDMLEKNVPEKYYLPDERIEKILNSSFMQEKKRIQMTDVCDTLLARDWKDPKCVPVEEDVTPIRIGNIYGENFGTGYAGNVWDKEGISPTLQTAQGGNRQPLVIDEIEITEPQVLRAERTEYGKSIRKQYEAGEVDEKIGNMREMKPRTDGIANTITTVLKDNYVVEAKEEKNLWTDTQKQMITEDGNIKRYINSDIVDEFNVGDCADISFPNGYNKANRVFDGYAPAINGTTTQSSFIVKEPIIYDDYNSRISADQDAINTLTCNCGASAERNGVKIIEQVAIVEDQFPGSRDARIYPEYSPTLRQNCGGLKVAKGAIMEKIRWRIRKLMPIECWKLMAFSRRDHNRAAKFVSNSALYKQAGNSIIVNCLTALMCSIFIKDGYKAEVWTKYVPNIND